MEEANRRAGRPPINPQQVEARRLLDRTMTFIDLETPSDEGIRLVELPARRVIARELPELLFAGTARRPSQRGELYGDREVHRAYGDLKRGLLGLARTGQGDPRVFTEGEQALKDLIRGMVFHEQGAREEVRPENAEAAARFMRDVAREYGGRAPEGPITPDEIDAMQVESLYVAQGDRYARRALEQILETVAAINQWNREYPLGKADPGPAR